MRWIAATLIVAIGGLPIAGIVCARECSVAHAAAVRAAEAAEHCHDDKLDDTTTIRRVLPDACSVIVGGGVAVHEPAAAPLAYAPVSLVQLQARGMPSPVAAVRDYLRRGRLTGLFPGDHVPLRI